MADLLVLESFVSTTQLPYCSPGSSPLHLEMLHPYLRHYPDPQFANYTAQGLQHGFHIGFHHGSPLCTASHNHSSSREHPSIITNQFYAELQLGRLLGPLSQPMAALTHVSPKQGSNKCRLVVDLSSPRGSSTNDGISPSLCSLRYASVDNA